VKLRCSAKTNVVLVKSNGGTFNADTTAFWSLYIFFITYNIGLLLTVIMMAVRGCIEVLNLEISTVIDSSISGMAGLGHIIITIAYILFFLILLNRINDADNK